MSWIRSHPTTALFWAALIAAAALLSVQLPLLYYSDDIVFHAAKVMDAAHGDFYSDPVTGFQSAYPPLYHIIVGTAASVLGLDSFQTSRAVQVVQFLGMFLGALFLFSGLLPKREQATLGSLALILLMYAPTGRYWLLGNPFNFSVMFVFVGVRLILEWYRGQKMWVGMAGAVVLGIGIDIWWWNVFPAAALALGVIVALARERRLRPASPGLLAIAGVAIIVMAYNLWPLYQIREVLPNYRSHMSQTSYYSAHGLAGTLAAWVVDFALKGNRQFFKYLYPAAMSSESRLVMAYGLAATVYFYLIVLPFNYLMLIGSGKGAVRLLSRKITDPKFILLVAALVTLLLSLVTLFQTNSSVTRRVQFYAFVFVLPAALWYAWERFGWDRRLKPPLGLAVICAGAMLFSVVYRFTVTLTNPESTATREVAAFIESLPDHANTRIFVSEYDNHRLLRVARYRSFELRGNPVYFRQDKRQADSIAAAYEAIIAGGAGAQRALREFETRYAVVGKKSAAISPVVTRTVENRLSGQLRAYFDGRGKRVLDNEDWVVYRLEYPFSLDTATAAGLEGTAGRPTAYNGKG